MQAIPPLSDVPNRQGLAFEGKKGDLNLCNASSCIEERKLDVHDTRGVLEPKKAMLDAGAIMEKEVMATERGGEFADGEVSQELKGNGFVVDGQFSSRITWGGYNF